MSLRLHTPAASSFFFGAIASAIPSSFFPRPLPLRASRNQPRSRNQTPTQCDERLLAHIKSTELTCSSPSSRGGHAQGLHNCSLAFLRNLISALLLQATVQPRCATRAALRRPRTLQLGEGRWPPPFCLSVSARKKCFLSKRVVRNVHSELAHSRKQHRASTDELEEGRPTVRAEMRTSQPLLLQASVASLTSRGNSRANLQRLPAVGVSRGPARLRVATHAELAGTNENWRGGAGRRSRSRDRDKAARATPASSIAPVTGVDAAGQDAVRADVQDGLSTESTPARVAGCVSLSHGSEQPCTVWRAGTSGPWK